MTYMPKDHVPTPQTYANSNNTSTALQVLNAFGRTVRKIIVTPVFICPGKDIYQPFRANTGPIRCISLIPWLCVSLVANYLTIGAPIGYAIVATMAVYAISDRFAKDEIHDENNDILKEKLNTNKIYDRDDLEKAKSRGFIEGYSKCAEEKSNKENDNSLSDLDIFGFSKLPTLEELKSKRKKLVMIYHADKVEHTANCDETMMKKINSAYERLLKKIR